MSFPISPTNGQQASINGITYTYSSALTAWTVSTSVSNSFVSISVAGNVNSGNLLATGTASVTGNITGSYFIGNGSLLTDISGIAVAVTAVEYPGIVNAADPAGGQTITVTGSGFNANITAYINSTSCATTYGNSTSLTFVTPATSAGTYNVIVYNTDGTNGTKPGGIVFSPIPVWVTAAGALTPGIEGYAYSTSVSATGDTIVYSLTSGSLPTGLSLDTSSGAITGTPTAAATSNFTITATDAQNQGVARSFSIEITPELLVDYIVVAGGGGATTYSGAGAGGFRTGIDFVVDPGATYTITVGAGGAGTFATFGNYGSDSVFSTITSTGGARGVSTGDGSNGGSGGGGGYDALTPGRAGGLGNTPSTSPSQGNDGGRGLTDNATYSAGGGGGGAGAVGGNAAYQQGGNGGNGTASSITGSSVTYAGGGGGRANTGTQGLGGTGGGGNASNNGTATNGTVNTGGGGGGDGAGGATGTGGSGVVILRFLSTTTVSATTGSPTITTDGLYQVYKYTGSGSITF